MKRYLGITIGPIIETMSYTSTPAGLWTASFFFSSITKDLYAELKRKEYHILTVPEHVECEVKGIGQYHDRIYATTPNNISDAEAADEVKSIISKVIKRKSEEIWNAFLPEKDIKLEDIESCLQAYLQIHFILLNVEDTQVLAKTLAEALDSLENCQTTAGNLSSNYLVRMLIGKRDNANCYIKKYEPFADARMLHLNNSSENIKDLKTIAENKEGMRTQLSKKLKNYFAIIQADGDGMGKIVNADLSDQTSHQVTLEEQENRIKMFSKLCMQYTAEASKLIQDYQGVVIYAGGDDLLFLVPIISKEDNIWTLCHKIGKKFNSIFNPAYNQEAGAIVKENQVPSISFGVSVNYYKFPLYEAFEDARNLLFGAAKNFGSKNNFALSVHKASGQTAGYVCRMETVGDSGETVFEEIIRYINFLIQKENILNENQMLHSLLYHIENQKELCKIALADKEKRDKFFSNVFDSTKQKDYQAYIDRINALTEKITSVMSPKDEKIAPLTVECSDVKEKAVNVLVNILRTSKFLVEEGE